MSSTTRRALRDFYKLPKETVDEPQNKTNQTSGANADFELEDDTTESTKIRELDNADVEVSDFVRKLTEDEPIESFISIVNQIKREKQILASAQRELVNDNYTKLIRASETLNYLSSQGDLAEVNSLKEPVNRLSEWNKSLAD